MAIARNVARRKARVKEKLHARSGIFNPARLN
jgi:hypothetical protein